MIRKQLGAAAEQGGLGMLLEVGVLQLQAFRPHQVIGIHACNQRCRCLVQSMIESGYQALSGIVEQLDTMISSSVMSQQVQGIIGRMIIDCQQFIIDQRLTTDRVEALFQCRFRITVWKKDTYKVSVHGGQFTVYGISTKQVVPEASSILVSIPGSVRCS